MLLYERITFLLVTGTLGIFCAALVCGAWGVALTFNPHLNDIVRARISLLISFLKALYARIPTKYRSISWHIPVRS